MAGHKDCKKCQQVEKSVQVPLGGILFESDNWIVVHKGAPIGVVGHLQVVSKRHYQSFANMTDEESAEIGPLLRHCQKLLIRASGAPKLYTAALGASFPHFHCHLVPVYPKGPEAWDVFTAELRAKEGKVQVDMHRCGEVAELFKAAIAADPPPVGGSAGGGGGVTKGLLGQAGLLVVAGAALLVRSLNKRKEESSAESGGEAREASS